MVLRRPGRTNELHKSSSGSIHASRYIYPCMQRVRGAGVQKALDKVPSAVFEKGIPGVRDYSLGSRFACIGIKFLEYSLAGMACGLVGQGIANTAMMARRANSPDEDFAVDPPPLVKSALVWGLFMGVSSNLRYQAVFGLERLVDGTIARRIPQVCTHPPPPLSSHCLDDTSAEAFHVPGQCKPPGHTESELGNMRMGAVRL